MTDYDCTSATSADAGWIKVSTEKNSYTMLHQSEAVGQELLPQCDSRVFWLKFAKGCISQRQCLESSGLHIDELIIKCRLWGSTATRYTNSHMHTELRDSNQHTLTTQTAPNFCIDIVDIGILTVKIKIEIETSLSCLPLAHGCSWARARVWISQDLT